MEDGFLLPIITHYQNERKCRAEKITVMQCAQKRDVIKIRL